MPFYEKRDVHIHYEEAGSSFPLLIVPGGGLNPTNSALATSHPITPFENGPGLDCTSFGSLRGRIGHSGIKYQRETQRRAEIQHV